MSQEGFPPPSDTNLAPSVEAGWQLLDTNPSPGLLPYLMAPPAVKDEARRAHVLSLLRDDHGILDASWSTKAASLERFLREGFTPTNDTVKALP